MASAPRSEQQSQSKPANASSSGIALVMVIAAAAMLSVVAMQLTKVSGISQALAFDSLDQVKAHYLAKSGFKLSLLRLKAYQQVKKMLGGNGNPNDPTAAAAAAAVPKSLVDKIWSFPFFYPFPADLPGITLGEKSVLEKFQKESGLQGSFTAVIESESSKFNINSILKDFAAAQPSPSPSAGPSPNPNGPGGRGTNPQQPDGRGNNPNNPNPQASPTAFDAVAARQSLQDLLANLLNSKIQEDDAFARDYRDYKLEDLMDQIAAYADKTYERRIPAGRDELAFKKAPFYRVSELHLLPLMDDELYNLFAPALTATKTAGINVNTIKDVGLKALIPNITDEQVQEFFKYRDDPNEEHTFKDEKDFYQYIQDAIFNRDSGATEKFKQDLAKRNIRILTDETDFKITVQARINNSVRTLEAWVSLTTAGSGGGTTPGANPSPTPSSNPNNPNNPQGDATGTNQAPDPGLRITFMRIL